MLSLRFKSLFLPLLCLVGSILTAHAQSIFTTDRNWTVEETVYRGNYFLTEIAAETADRVLMFQLADGGWPKGIYYPAPLAANETLDISETKKRLTSSLTGRTTLSEIHFLSNMYQATARRKYKKSVEDGIGFLVHSQFDNGGWSSLAGNASTVVSFADNTFIEVMAVLWRIAEGRQPYDFVSADLRRQCREAFERGVGLILSTQCVQEGKPTIWCTCYDARTLQPVAGNAQEPMALNSQLSDNLVTLLMGLGEPSAPIVQAIEGAIEWYKANKVSGLTRQNYINKEGKRDFRFIEDRHAPDMWALYYHPLTNQPIFCEIDGEMKNSLDELTYDGRKSQSWYNNDGGKLLRNYEKWKEARQ